MCGGAAKRKYCGISCYRVWQRSRPIEERFWAKVQKTPACWLWTGSRGNAYGHGAFHIGKSDASPTYAHRYAWALANGPIPAGAHVLHTCDVPLCVNPAHLFLGDHDANMKDAASKCRFNVPRPRRRKVTDEQVAEMFVLRKQGLTLAAIGAEFDVTKCFVSLTLRGLRRVYTAPQLQQPKESAA